MKEQEKGNYAHCLRKICSKFIKLNFKRLQAKKYLFKKLGISTCVKVISQAIVGENNAYNFEFTEFNLKIAGGS